MTIDTQDLIDAVQANLTPHLLTISRRGTVLLQPRPCYTWSGDTVPTW